MTTSILLSGDQEDLLSVKYFSVVWLLGFRVLLFVPCVHRSTCAFSSCTSLVFIMDGWNERIPE